MFSRQTIADENRRLGREVEQAIMAFKMNLKHLVAFSCQLSLRAILLHINRDRVRVPQGYLEWIEYRWLSATHLGLGHRLHPFLAIPRLFGRPTD